MTDERERQLHERELARINADKPTIAGALSWVAFWIAVAIVLAAALLAGWTPWTECSPP